jgi:HSP20 family protein
MTENIPHTKRNIIVPALVIALFIAVGIQTWFMVGMKRQLNTMHAAADPASGTVASASTSPLPAITQNQNQPSSSAPGSQNNASPFNSSLFGQNFGTGNWNPDKQFAQMRHEMDNMISQAMGSFNHHQGFQKFFDSSSLSSPDIKIQDKGKQYQVLVKLPGADKNDISVSLNDNVLTVSGQQKHVESRTDKNGNTIFQSQQSGSFSRSVSLPGDVKPGSMHTEFNNDTLKITISKAA